MHHTQFDNIIASTFEKAETTLTRKSAAYSSESDRLHNFRTAAALNGSTMEQALWGMLTKHIVSLRDMVKTGHAHSPDLWDEKIGDAINYLAILRAIVSETEWTPESDDPRHKVGIEITPQYTLGSDGKMVRPNTEPPYSAGKDSRFNTKQQRDIDSIKRVADKHNY